jgi:hypothetical protein
MADVRRAWHTITEFGAWWESEIITRLVRAESITETEKGKGITISQGHASGCIGVSGYGDACRSLGELCIPWKRQKKPGQISLHQTAPPHSPPSCHTGLMERGLATFQEPPQKQSENHLHCFYARKLNKACDGQHVSSLLDGTAPWSSLVSRWHSISRPNVARFSVNGQPPTGANGLEGRGGRNLLPLHRDRRRTVCSMYWFWGWFVK